MHHQSIHYDPVWPVTELHLLISVFIFIPLCGIQLLGHIRWFILRYFPPVPWSRKNQRWKMSRCHFHFVKPCTSAAPVAAGEAIVRNMSVLFSVMLPVTKANLDFVTFHIAPSNAEQAARWRERCFLLIPGAAGWIGLWLVLIGDERQSASAMDLFQTRLSQQWMSGARCFIDVAIFTPLISVVILIVKNPKHLTEASSPSLRCWWLPVAGV